MFRWLRRIAPGVLLLRGQQPARSRRVPRSTPAEHPPEAEQAPPPAPVDSERRFLWLLIALATSIVLFLIALAAGIDHGLAISVAVAALAFWGTALLWKVPRWQAEGRTGLSEKEKFDVENSARGTLGSLLGTVTLLAGIFFAWQQFDNTNQTLHLSEQGQITERFTRAVDQLGSNDLVTRLGGIYGLERISRDSDRDAGPVMDVLAAYVRQWAPRQPTGHSTPAADPQVTIPVDVQAVLEVIGRRPRDLVLTRCIDLSDTSLPGAQLPGANLTNLCLDRADLSGASLAEADFSGSDLRSANLTSADLGRARLLKTTLSSADLSGANLSGANLTGARLDNAALRNTILQNATLRDVFLNGASLEGALLFGADLSNAELVDADLTGAVLADADLSAAKSLTQAQVDRAAVVDDDTALPPGIEIPGALSATPGG